MSGFSRSLVFAVLVAGVVLAPAGTLLAQDASPLTGELRERIQPLVDRLERDGYRVGLLAEDVNGERTLIASRPDEARIPASVQKLLTASAALLGPGADHLMLTDLVAHGPLEDGVIDGHLRLRGEGDPTLTAKATLERYVNRMKELGIRRVTGDLLVDDRLFTSTRRAPGWPTSADEAATWLSGPAALSLDGGTALLAIVGKGKPRVEVRPAGTSLAIDNRLDWSQQNKRRVRLRWNAERTGLLVTGVTPRKSGEAHRAAIPDPGLFFGEALRAALVRSGIAVDGGVRRPSEEELVRGGSLVMRVETPVGSILGRILKNSDNHWAEQLFSHLGAHATARGGFEGGRVALQKILGEAGLGKEGEAIVDGSGLSRENRVSPRSILGVLAQVREAGQFSRLEAALAHGGEKGSTLRRRLQEIGPRVRAKTGTLRGVKGLAGTLRTAAGRRVDFAILTEAPQRLSGSSAGRQRAFEDAVVRILDGWKGR